MKTLVLYALMATQSASYQFGNMPYCADDGFGNLQCFYVTREICEATNQVCVVNPRR